jgi:hypothetical protein
MSDSTFEDVPALSHPTGLVVGGDFACAQDDNGIRCWGDNDSAITQAPTLSNPRKIIASARDVCALDDNGVECWGDQNPPIGNIPSAHGPTDFVMGLGYACAVEKTQMECYGSSQGGPPIPDVPAPPTNAQYTSGQSHICGLDSTGVHCWGDNGLSQLQVPTLSHPTKIFGDPTGNQTCALDDSGLVCWGEDQAGQSSLSPVSSLSTELGNTCVTAQGQIQCWGQAATAINSAPAISDSYQVALGLNFACTMDVGTLSGQSCWGDNLNLQSLTPPLPMMDYSSGAQLTTPSPLFAIGENHLCLYLNGQLSCVGNNDYGQAKVPANFMSSGNIGTLSAGGNHSCGIDSIKGLECWGEDTYGESTPPTTLINPRQVSAGQFHSCALDDAGVTCWGRSSEGQTTVPKLVNPRFVQAGGYHTCALDDNGVTCWGDNSFGQLQPPASLANQGRKITTLSSGLFNTCVATQ